MLADGVGHLHLWLGGWGGHARLELAHFSLVVRVVGVRLGEEVEARVLRLSLADLVLKVQSVSGHKQCRLVNNG